MIELLILFELSKKVMTMYGISKEIHGDFSALTTPSFGTISPALDRLEKSGFILYQKTMSEGGRPSKYFSITPEGKEELRRLILEPPVENPIHFLPMARVKLACAGKLDKNDQINMLKTLKTKANEIIINAENVISFKDLPVFTKTVYVNLIDEYKRFIEILERLNSVSNSK